MSTTPTPSPVTPTPNVIDLATVADVKSYLGIPVNSTVDDVTLQRLITGASLYWLQRTGRPSLNQILPFTDRYDGNGRDELILRHYPVQAVTSLKIDGQTIPRSPDYLQSGWVLNDKADSLILLGNYSFWRGRLNVELIATAGYDGVPPDVNEAVVKQVGVNYKRKHTLDQATLALPQGGGTTAWRSWELPPEVERVLESYKPWNLT